MVDERPALVMALFLGSQHVMVAASEEFARVSGSAAPIGQPVREAYVEHVWNAVIEMMDEVYETGVSLFADFPQGRLGFSPVRDGGRIVGVVSHYRVAVAPTAQRVEQFLGLTG